MNREDIKNELFKILRLIQTQCGEDCPDLDEKITPVKDLKGFSSKIWPTAIGMLAQNTKIEIPNDVDIFYDKKTHTEYTIAQAVDMVVKLSAEKKEE